MFFEKLIRKIMFCRSDSVSQVDHERQRLVVTVDDKLRWAEVHQVIFLPLFLNNILSN